MISWLGGEVEEEGNFGLAEPLDWLDKKLKQKSVYIQNIMIMGHIKLYE